MADLVRDKVVSSEKDADPNSIPKAMDEELSALRSELSALRAKVAQLESELHCGICRGPLHIPISLPCGHSFCSACARRALLSRSRCVEAHCTTETTTADIRPVRALEACVAQLFPVTSTCVNSIGEKPARGKMPHLPRASRATLAAALRSIGLRTDGAVDVLAKRHREFVLLWNANLDSSSPLPEAAIAAQVMSSEKALAVAASRRPGRKVTNLFRKRPASLPPEDSDLPEEGDGHEALIRKIRRREGLPVAQPRPLELTPPSTPSRRDLALSDAADRVTQSPEVQEVPVAPPSPSSSDLALIDAADRASQSQEVNGIPSSPRTPSRPAQRDDFWADADDSCSTIAPSPVRPPPMQQSPLRPPSRQRPTSGLPGPGASFTASPVRPPLMPQSPHFSNVQRPSSAHSQASTVFALSKDSHPRPPQAQQASREKIHVVPWRQFPNKHTQSPVSFGAGTHVTPAGGPPGVGRPAGPRNAQLQRPTLSSFSASGYQQQRGPMSHGASPSGPYAPGSSWRQTVSNGTQPAFSQSQGPSQAPVRPPLTEEQRARIERNRQQAVQRQLAARKRREEMLRGAPR